MGASSSKDNVSFSISKELSKYIGNDPKNIVAEYLFDRGEMIHRISWRFDLTSYYLFNETEIIRGTEREVEADKAMRMINHFASKFKDISVRHYFASEHYHYFNTDDFSVYIYDGDNYIHLVNVVVSESYKGTDIVKVTIKRDGSLAFCYYFTPFDLFFNMEGKCIFKKLSSVPSFCKLQN